jgi:hypothetical protein
MKQLAQFWKTSLVSKLIVGGGVVSLCLIGLVCVLLFGDTRQDRTLSGTHASTISTVAFVAVQEDDAVPATATPRPSLTPTPLPTSTPTNTPEPTYTPTNTLTPTATPEPTSTPEPSPTPEPPTPIPEPSRPLVTAGEANVNIRSGPGENYAIVDILAARQSLDIVGRNADASWWQVPTPNGLGWLSASVTTASNVEEVPLVAEVPPPPRPTESAVAEAGSSLPAGGDLVVISAVNDRDEYVDIQNIGDTAMDLTGWHLLSEKGVQDCVLGGVIQPGEVLRVWALRKDSGRGGYNCDFGRNIWNNSEPDPAILYDPAGVEMSRGD